METHCVFLKLSTEFLCVIYMNGTVQNFNEQEL
jgi:hypothetical protein